MAAPSLPQYAVSLDPQPKARLTPRRISPLLQRRLPQPQAMVIVWCDRCRSHAFSWRAHHKVVKRFSTVFHCDFGVDALGCVLAAGVSPLAASFEWSPSPLTAGETTRCRAEMLGAYEDGGAATRRGVGSASVNEEAWDRCSKGHAARAISWLVFSLKANAFCLALTCKTAYRARDSHQEE